MELFFLSKYAHVEYRWFSNLLLIQNYILETEPQNQYLGWFWLIL